MMAVDAKSIWLFRVELLVRGFSCVYLPKWNNKMIKTVYKSPLAYVYSNGVLSEAIQITRGTRQGCPLSPLLFALAVELMAQKILQSAMTSGIKVGKEC